jgi:hypothetical protein
LTLSPVQKVRCTHSITVNQGVFLLWSSSFCAPTGKLLAKLLGTINSLPEQGRVWLRNSGHTLSFTSH